MGYKGSLPSGGGSIPDSPWENPPQWDDVYTVPSLLDISGTNPPVRKQFLNDGIGGTDSAVRFVENTGAEGAMYVELENTVNAGDFTIEFWVKPERSNPEYLIRFDNNCFVRLAPSGGGAVLSYDFGSTGVSTQLLNLGAWNHCCLCVSKTFNYARVWTNGQLTQSTVGNTPISAESVYTIGYEGDIGSSNNFIGTLDIFTVYNVVLTDSQVLERYNTGVPTEDLPTGITDANRVLYIPFDDNGGNTLTNTKGNNALLEGTAGTSFEWVTGAIGTTGSLGTYLPVFEYQARQSAGFTFPIPHGWEIGSNFRPHTHFSVKEQPIAGQTFTLDVEYVLGRIGTVYTNTTITQLTYTFDGTEQPYEHLLWSWGDLVPTGIDGVSPQLDYTVTRGVDTFPHDVYLLNFGNHIRYDQVGSRQELVK